jgi:putative SOS response-associated peptidase YedK
MCGRFTLAERLEQLQKRFEILDITYDYRPSYNIAPTDPITTITMHNSDSFTRILWGMPLKIEKLNNLLINTRDDKILSNNFFHRMFSSSRCLIPASGFFEWQKSGSSKIPFFIKTIEPIISFAGLYYKIQDNFYSTIITTNANSLVSDLHDRMPVILSKDEEKLWLNTETPETELNDLLDPYPADLMRYYQISKKVNSVKNNSPDILKPISTSSLSDFF